MKAAIKIIQVGFPSKTTLENPRDFHSGSSWLLTALGEIFYKLSVHLLHLHQLMESSRTPWTTPGCSKPLPWIFWVSRTSLPTLTEQNFSLNIQSQQFSASLKLLPLVLSPPALADNPSCESNTQKSHKKSSGTCTTLPHLPKI